MTTQIADSTMPSDQFHRHDGVLAPEPGVHPFPGTGEAVADDDRAIARAFLQKEEGAGRLLRIVGKGDIRLYDRDSGTWRRLGKCDVIALNDRLWDCVLACVGPDEREDGIGRRYRSVRKTLFETAAEFHASPDDFDREKYKLALSKSVLDLKHDEVLDHSPDHMLTVGLGYGYDPTAKCPLFDGFIGDVLVKHEDPEDETSPLVPDPQLRLLVQEMMGYCLATHCQGERGFFLLGHGRNGKSVLLHVIRQLLGEHNVCDGFDIRRLSNPNSAIRLLGKLVAVGIEQQQGVVINEAAYKAFISGESLPARLLYRDEVSITPYAKLIVPGNVLPETRDRSRGFWERTIVIPFLNSFLGEAADTELRRKLGAELPGILNFALEGYRRLRDRDWKFTVSQSAVRTTTIYHDDSDPVLLWLNDCLRPSATEARVPSMAPYEHYTAYCTERRYQLDNYNNFTKRLKVIAANREGEPWSTVAEDGTPFSLAYRRTATSRAYVGHFALGRSDG